MNTEHAMEPPLARSQAPAGKKKAGGMNIFRAAWLRRHRCPEKKARESPDSNPSSKGMLNKVVGSMRPLHLHSHRSPQHPRELVSADPPSTNEQYEDVLLSPMSTPCKMTRSSSRSSVSEEGTRRFMSVGNLVDLDCASEDDDCDRYVDEGDETIDVKADQFIAQFYEQMRTQNHNRKVKMSSRRRI